MFLQRDEYPAFRHFVSSITSSSSGSGASDMDFFLRRTAPIHCLQVTTRLPRPPICPCSLGTRIIDLYAVIAKMAATAGRRLFIEFDEAFDIPRHFRKSVFCLNAHHKSVADVIRDVAQRWSLQEEDLLLAINGYALHPSELASALQDGDTVRCVICSLVCLPFGRAV